MMPIEGIRVEEYNAGVPAGRLGVDFDEERYQSSRNFVTIDGDTHFDIQAIRR